MGILHCAECGRPQGVVDPQSPSSSFLVWTFYAAYIMLIAVVFTFGFVHSGLYIYRGFKDGLYSRRRHDS